MKIEDYIRIFNNGVIPTFLFPYLNTKTLERLRYVSQFCGCDYTKIYNPRLFYTRFSHSLVVALINYHFTHDKKSTIASLLHDIKTPCFAHTIDYVLGDYKTQEASEAKMDGALFLDKEIIVLLKNDGIGTDEILNLSRYPILENKSPRLCADRLDGVLHTCAIWLGTHSLNQIAFVYQNLEVLDFDDTLELGFTDEAVALQFALMVLVYAKELQSNRNKFTMQFTCDMIKKIIADGYISLEDLYTKKESEIIKILDSYPSWQIFKNANSVISSDEAPTDDSYVVSIESKRRNVIPLLKSDGVIDRLDKVSTDAKKIYQDIADFKDSKYAYVRELKKL